LTIDLDTIGLDQGGHLIIGRVLNQMHEGERVRITGSDPHLELHLRVWARSRGHKAEGRWLIKGNVEKSRWNDAIRTSTEEPESSADATWGLSARGSLMETGGPPLVGHDLDEKIGLWADIAPRLYAQAVSAQWDPNEAIDWTLPTHPDHEVEDAVIQLMTYLIENEQAALLVPAKFIGRIHPHYREILQLLAIQIADEARHIEVFTRRARISGRPLGRSGVAGRASLQTLLEEPDYSLASLLLSVLGEGTFLNLLSFIQRHAPDAITARICELARRDEARHVTFGLAHLEYRVQQEPSLRTRMFSAVEQRHESLRSTSGLSGDVFDALVILAAGEWTPSAVRSGWSLVQELQKEMDEGRRRRLTRLGFSGNEAAHLSSLHTRNFM